MNYADFRKNKGFATPNIVKPPAKKSGGNTGERGGYDGLKKPELIALAKEKSIYTGEMDKKNFTVAMLIETLIAADRAVPPANGGGDNTGEQE
jgi:hypothetical protein